MHLPPINFEFDNVVVGWRAEAIAFARAHNYHLIVGSEHRPFHYSVGLEEVKSAWLEGIYDLGMKGLLPVPFGVGTLMLEDGDLKIVTKGNTRVKIAFEKLHVFDLDNFDSLEVKETIEDHVVHDMFDVVQGARVGLNFTLFSNEDVLKSIKFVASNRIDKNTTGEFKDIIVRSVIADADLKSFDFSETVVRVLLERKLKEYNITSLQGTPLKVRHSFRHTNKRRFRMEPIDNLDARVILHG